MHRFQKQESVLFKKLLRQPEGLEKKLAVWLSACTSLLVSGLRRCKASRDGGGAGGEVAAVVAALTEGLFGEMRNLKVSLFISSSGELGGFFSQSPFQ